MNEQVSAEVLHSISADGDYTIDKVDVYRMARELLALREREAELRKLIKAADIADWDQVILNGGPPCFHLEAEGKFCLRAERWEGHKYYHQFTPLAAAIELAITSDAASRSREINMADTKPTPMLTHTRGCFAFHDPITGGEVHTEKCTCGLRYRIETQTAETMSAAWRKRATEAETESAAQTERISELEQQLAEANKELTNVTFGEAAQRRVKVIEQATIERCAKVCLSITLARRRIQDGFLAACDEAQADGHRLALHRAAEAIRALRAAEPTGEQPVVPPRGRVFNINDDFGLDDQPAPPASPKPPSEGG